MRNPFCEGEHYWERSPGGSARGEGTMWYSQCNNCLALKIVQEWITSTTSEGYFYEARVTVVGPMGSTWPVSGFRPFGGTGHMHGYDYFDKKEKKS